MGCGEQRHNLINGPEIKINYWIMVLQNNEIHTKIKFENGYNQFRDLEPLVIWLLNLPSKWVKIGSSLPLFNMLITATSSHCLSTSTLGLFGASNSRLS